MSKSHHDTLQAECFCWLWNQRRDTRFLCHANFNSHAKWRAREISYLKSLGLVKGVTDMEFYWKGVLYVFDVKVGADKLSKHQQAFIRQVELHGGKFYEIRSLEQFQTIIDNILTLDFL